MEHVKNREPKDGRNGNAMKRVNTRSEVSAIIGAVALVFLLGVPALVHASSCSAVGKFAFTIGAGAGRLVLSADGSASMSLVPNHLILCDVCALPARALTGTYRTGDIGNGECGFMLDLAEADGSKISMGGVVAFQGSVLLFQLATVSSFGPGLALRTDTLTGQ